MKQQNRNFFSRKILIFFVLMGLLSAARIPAYAALTVDPLTWNVVGLDSNNVAVGPNHFPVGARVCNSGGATTATVQFHWDDSQGVFENSASPDPYINLRSGTLGSIVLSFTGSGCQDAYFEAAVTRNSSAYEKTRPYYITADNGTTYSSPRPRELFVEHLISQSRNSVLNVRVDGTPVVPGGTMTLMVGQTYDITINGSTATNGYNQLEEFINFPNTIFQVLAVSTTYSANNDPSPDLTRMYGNACKWENNPGSPNYRSCIGGDAKNGGDVDITYTVKILSAPPSPLVNPVPLSTLIYDFSGSSYHYNADFSVASRFANIVNAGVIKSFSPKTIVPNGTSSLTFTVNNPGPNPITNVNFTDTFPAGLTVASPTGMVYTNCGTPSPTAVSVTPGTNTFSFSNITVPGYGACTIAVNVTASSNGSYPNTTGHLLIGTDDTGSFGTDTLTVSSLPGPPTSCASPVQVATWNFTGDTLGTNGGPFTGTTTQGDVTGITGTYNPLAGTSSSAVCTDVSCVFLNNNGNGTLFPVALAGNTWGIRGGWPLGGVVPNGTTTPSFGFQVNAANYGGLTFSTSANLQGSWSNSDSWYVLASTDGSTWTQVGTGAWGTSTFKNNWGTVSSTSSPANAATTRYRVVISGAASGKADPTIFIDNVAINGCPRPLPPTIAKSFSAAAIQQGSSSTLTFNIANPNGAPNNYPLAGIAFTDVIPAGLTVADGTYSCGGVNNVTVTAATNTISMTGGSLAASGSCTFNLPVTGAATGSYTNVTTNITSADSGPNTGGADVGYGYETLDVVAPPVLAKSFDSTFVLTGGTTDLNFTVTNPNGAAAMTGIGFSDPLPAGLTVATGSSSQCGGTLTTTAPSTISFAGGSLAAAGSCTFSVTVTGATNGQKDNTTAAVTGTVSGVSTTGNTASASILVRAQTSGISVLKKVAPTATGAWTSFLNLGDPGLLPKDVYFTFRIENTGDTTLNSVRINELTFPGLDVSACNFGSLNLYDYQDCVAGPVTVSSSGVYANTANATSDTATSGNSTASYATTGLLLIKNVAQSALPAAGQPLNYSYSVYNNGGASLTGPVTISDDKATVTCPLVTTVGDGDNELEDGEGLVCTATYTVLPADVTAGYVTNIATASADGVNSNTATQTVLKSGVPDLRVTKGNNTGGAIILGNSFTWTLLVSNAGLSDAIFANGLTIVSDPLPVSATYGSPTTGSFTNITNSGNISCSISVGNLLTCTASGAAVTIGNTSGSFTVSIPVTPTAAGSLANTATVDPGTSIPEAIETNNTGSDTVTVYGHPAIAKAFGTNPITAGGTSVITFTLTNPNGVPMTGSNFTDTLSNMAISGNQNAGGTCTGAATNSFSDAATSLSFSGITIPAGGSCTVTVLVTSSTLGTHPNTTSGVTTTEVPTAGSASNTANLTVYGHPTIAKAFGTSPILAGGTSTITFTLTNPNGVPMTGSNFTDTLSNMAISGNQNAGGTCTGSATNSFSDGTTNLSFSGITIPAGGSCTVTVLVTSSIVGTHPNTTSGVTTTEVPTAGSASNTASLTVNEIADVTTTVTVPATANAGSTVNGTVTFGNNGPSTAAGGSYTFTITPGLGSVSFPTLPPGVTASYDNGSGTVTLGNMPGSLTSGQTLTFGFSYTAPNTGPVAVTTTIATSTTESNAGNNSASGSTAIAAADVTTTVTAPAVANTGTTVTVPITFSNLGALTAANVTYSLQLDPGLSGVTCSGATCSYDSGTGAITVAGLPGSLTSGQTVGIVLNYTAPAVGATITVDSSIGTTSLESNSGNNTASDSTTIALNNTTYDVTTTVVAPPAANAGSPVNVAITYTNLGPATATGVTYAASLPPGLGGFSCTAIPGYTCTYNGGSGAVTVTGPVSLLSGQTESITLIYTAPGSGPVVATSTIGTTPVDSNVLNNTASDSTEITTDTNADVTTTVSAPATAVAGSTVQVPVTFSNNGPATAADVTYSITLPPGLDLFGVVACSGATCSYNNLSGLVTISGLPVTLATGQTEGLTLSYTAPGSGTVALTSTIATSTAESNNGNNTAAGSTDITVLADVTTTVIAPATATGGSVVNVPITFANVGASTADGVTYSAHMNPGLSGFSCSNALGVTCSYNNITGDVTFTGLPGSLASGVTENITLTYTAPGSGSVTVTTAITTTTNQGANAAPDNASGTTNINALTCDVDLNGQVDSADITLIFSNRGLMALPGDSRDLDGDLLITINDARGCVLNCTNASCAP